jgi:diguanylate cyclase (GGDEF)-like protein
VIRSTASLRRRLVVSLVAAALLPFAGAAWIAHAVSVDDARAAARDRLDAVTQGASGAIEGAVQQARGQATALARDRRVQTALVLNDTYTLGAMSAAGASITAGRPVPAPYPSVQVVVRAEGKPIGFVSVRLPEPAALLQQAQSAVGSRVALRLVRDGETIIRSGPVAPEEPAPASVREQAVPALGEGTSLVVVDTARPPQATDVQARLGLALAISLLAIAALAATLARPLLGRIQVVEDAAAEADVDPLTELANRRAFDRALEHELIRSTRTQRPCALVMIDLDDFKKLNDAYGHAVGDDALRGVADALESQIRAIDLAARLGGEELAVLLPETSAEHALVVAQRLRAAIEAVEVRSVDGRLLPITGSLGVADTSHDPTPIGLQKRADAALYAAKRAGKNRVEMAPRHLEEAPAAAISAA